MREGRRILNKQAGFTLVEVLIGILLLAAISLLMQGYNALNRQRYETAWAFNEATRLADAEMERVRAIVALNKTERVTTKIDFQQYKDMTYTKKGRNFSVNYALTTQVIDTNGEIIDNAAATAILSKHRMVVLEDETGTWNHYNWNFDPPKPIAERLTWYFCGPGANCPDSSLISTLIARSNIQTMTITVRLLQSNGQPSDIAVSRVIRLK